MSPLFQLSVFFAAICLVGCGVAHSHHDGEENQNSVGALKNVLQTSYEAPGRFMMLKRDLLNITIDTDKIDEEPLTASDLLLRAKLMAYVQKLVAKEEKKKLKEAKKAEKAKMKAAMLGLPPSVMAPPSPVTVSPPLPIPTSVNLSGSEPLPPQGFWLYKKAAFLAKLFTALADAAATLPGVTTPAPLDSEDEITTPTLVSDDDENEEEDTSDPTIVNVNDKRSVEYDSDEDDDDDFDAEFKEQVYVEETPTTKIRKYTTKKSSKSYKGSPKKSKKHQETSPHHNYRNHNRREE